ncbi:MAG: transposase [Tepidiforma sp.]|uniref:RNA-guided endonuclease InsQ/TnpB family protein n=1 Tax=Tepidiforma sp. TaxID=2682230 RepID=UPI001857AF06|nr:transposase [Tepidiforma sp.]GIW16840.1 MAG: transposase [Tepidiforma sp.]
MNTTLIVKLAPTNEQHTLLLATMERFNEACNWIADVAFKHRTAGKYKLQKMLYHEIRDSFGLSAQMTVRAISKVAEAYRRDKRIKPTFNPHGAIVYDQRILSWKGIDRVSLLTLEGRELIPVIMGGYQADRLAAYGKRGQADLIYRDGTFYLAVVVDIPEPPPSEGTGVLGVDMGIANLATDSDGETYSGEQVDAKRRHYERMRAGLQRVGTKSSRRKLKRIRRRERRFKRNVNHTISKRLVAKASDTGRDLAIEDLGGIRERTTVRKAQRSRHSKWAFGELRQFLTYKAALAGVRLHVVDPRNTSRTCPICGHCDKRNRPDQATFRCTSCGYAGHADVVAAANIAARAAVSQPMVSDEAFASAPGTSPRALAVGN